VESTIPFNILY